MSASVRAARRPVEAYSPDERACPYCCAQLPSAAKKCGACGEWVVRTSAGVAAAGLRLLAMLWGTLTVLGVAALWTLAQGARRWVLLRSVDPEVTPFVFDVVLYGVLAIALLQGLTMSFGLGVLARFVPRRPAWWS